MEEKIQIDMLNFKYGKLNISTCHRRLAKKVKQLLDEKKCEYCTCVLCGEKKLWTFTLKNSFKNSLDLTYELYQIEKQEAKRYEKRRRHKTNHTNNT